MADGNTIPNERRAMALVVADESPFANLLDTGKFEHMWRVATLFSKSKLIPVHFQGKPEDCFVATQMAVRLGVDPFMFMQNTYVTNGKPGMEGKLAIALINARGPFAGPIQWELTGEGDGRACRAYAKHKDTGEVCDVSVTVQMAKDEGWYGRNPKWKNLTDLMLRYRSGAWLGRLYAPECLMGMQTSEELDDIANHRGAENAKDVTPARPTRQQFRDAPEMDRAAKPGEGFVIIDGDGVEGIFADAMAAHDALVTALKAAPDEKNVEGIWESNGLLLSQLREGGLASAAESLHTVYDGRLKEFARPDTSSPAHGNGADAPTAHPGAPQGTGAAAPQPSATMADSTPEERRPPAQPTPSPAPHKAEGHVKAGGDLLGGRPAESKPAPGKAPNSPLAKTGPKGNWGAFTPWLLEQLRTLPRDKISDFIAAHSAECDYFAENQTDVWDEAQKIMDARRG